MQLLLTKLRIFCADCGETHYFSVESEYSLDYLIEGLSYNPVDHTATSGPTVMEAALLIPIVLLMRTNS